MSASEMFYSNLVNLEMNENATKDLFDSIAAKLESIKFVNRGYKEGLKVREQEFPTGLKTEFLDIALPHSDTKYIKRPFIFVVKNKKSLEMKQMGDNQEMKVNYFFFLGIKDPTKQVKLLQLLMKLFQDEQFVDQFVQIQKNKLAYELLKNKVKELEEKEHV